jgi:hypothetical protein
MKSKAPTEYHVSDRTGRSMSACAYCATYDDIIVLVFTTIGPGMQYLVLVNKSWNKKTKRKQTNTITSTTTLNSTQPNKNPGDSDTSTHWVLRSHRDTPHNSRTVPMHWFVPTNARSCYNSCEILQYKIHLGAHSSRVCEGNERDATAMHRVSRKYAVNKHVLTQNDKHTRPNTHQTNTHKTHIK